MKITYIRILVLFIISCVIFIGLSILWAFIVYHAMPSLDMNNTIIKNITPQIDSNAELKLVNTNQLSKYYIMKIINKPMSDILYPGYGFIYPGF